ncbi:HIT family protein [Roseobacter sp. MH60115]|uniref:HIT family protein n=1 Tax=Roseobacter sp. MH60115 TaxID=2785324 RepID=UPI0018A2E280|nr:HIT domain-containing protein [Roseobacter sp. MH60115]
MAAMDLKDTQPDSGNKFHWLFLQGQSSTTAIYDTVVEETQNFAVLPTKGSIVPGWVLVVPKFPTPRIADVPEELHAELGALVQRVSGKLESAFGNTYTFEHGGLKGSKISCGVDQAHLHIAALDFDLVQAAMSETAGSWIDASSAIFPSAELAEGEYWFVSAGDTAKFKTVDKPCSQFFRRIIARKAGHSGLWDYRSEDFMENVTSTIKAMGANG